MDNTSVCYLRLMECHLARIAALRQEAESCRAALQSLDIARVENSIATQSLMLGELQAFDKLGKPPDSLIRDPQFERLAAAATEAALQLRHSCRLNVAVLRRSRRSLAAVTNVVFAATDTYPSFYAVAALSELT